MSEKLRRCSEATSTRLGPPRQKGATTLEDAEKVLSLAVPIADDIENIVCLFLCLTLQLEFHLRPSNDDFSLLKSSPKETQRPANEHSAAKRPCIHDKAEYLLHLCIWRVFPPCI